MKKEALGTIVYLDGIKSHLGMVGGYTTDKFGDEAYLLAVALTDGELAFNDAEDAEAFAVPVEICDKASEEDTQMFFNKMMKRK